MSDARGTAVAPNKLAMSRALGAAFLSHQVEQLEKSVNGPASGNWRDRKQASSYAAAGRGAAPVKRPQPPSPAKGVIKKRVDVPAERPKEAPEARGRRSDEREDNDADIIVVDASVLVHALYQVKKWCRDGRSEVLIVPLEALNTLDLLKKGTSALAQRARAASRILEAQVGTNPRIRVQRDDAFVLWDKIPFDTSTDNAAGAPEWVRRTICCARWEADNNPAAPGATAKPKVVLAVLAGPPNLSPPAQLLKLSADSALAPVPLPAPHVPANKHEPRSAGAVVSTWAARAGIEMLEIAPTAPGGPLGAPNGRVSEDDERRRPSHVHAPKGRKTSGGPPGLVERPPAVMAMMEMVAQPSKVVRLLARGEKLDPDP